MHDTKVNVIQCSHAQIGSLSKIMFKIMMHETSNVILKSFLMVTCTFSGTSCGTGVPDSKSPATEPVFTWSKYREETRVTKAETNLNTKFHCHVKYKQSLA